MTIKRCLQPIAGLLVLGLLGVACSSNHADIASDPATSTTIAVEDSTGTDVNADTVSTTTTASEMTASETADNDASKSLATGPGFDGETIRVGIISSLSGPDAIFGHPFTVGGQVYYDYVNSQGGIAGKYPIETVEVDNKFDPATTLRAYNDITDDVVMIGQVTGTSPTYALLESLREDDLVAGTASSDSFWVREPNLLPNGAPYQIQVINGLDWWINEGSGTVDQVYCSFIDERPYGEAIQQGIDFAAEKLGFSITQVARFSVEDMEYVARIQKLQATGCEVIVIAVPAAIVSGGLDTAAVNGYAPQWIGISPTWHHIFAVGGNLAPYFQKNLIIVGEGSTWGDDTVPGMANMIERFDRFAPDEPPDYYHTFGYLQAHAVVQLLEAAVANGDLSRQGIIDALNNLGTVSFDGLAGDYFYGTPEARIPSTQNTIFAVNPDMPNGLEAIAHSHEASFASDFVFD